MNIAQRVAQLEQTYITKADTRKPLLVNLIKSDDTDTDAGMLFIYTGKNKGMHYLNDMQVMQYEHGQNVDALLLPS